MDKQTPQRLRIGIIGCGKVAEHHARFIKQQPNAELVGVGDVNLEAAKRFAATYDIPLAAGSLDDLLEKGRLDVLHVVTPPSFHYQCARTALDRGIHVFIEKPVAFRVDEVADLYDRANARGLVLCPDFIQLFHPKMQEVITRIEGGEMGRVVHVESQLCVNLEDSPEIREAPGLHWAYRLPGGLLRDYTSHVLYQVLYFAGWPEQIQVARAASGSLPQGLIDHLSIQINGTQCTGTVLLSCLPRPATYEVRILCEKGSAHISFDTQTLMLNVPSFLPRRITAALGNFFQSGSLSWQATANIVNFLRGKLVPYAGLQGLIPKLYNAILTTRVPPLSRELALAVTMAEETIFSTPTDLCASGCYVPSTQSDLRHRERVLVTGANGYVGRQIVKALVGEGYYVRAMVRPTSSIESLKRLGVEIFFGDVRRLDQVNSAVSGMDLVVHAAAGMQGNSEFVVETSVHGTKTIAEAASSHGIKRVIYLSSFSVYDYAKMRSGEWVNEESPLEEQASTRGDYSLGKREAEKIALAQLQDPSTPWTILRPSLVVGRGKDIFSPVGPKLGRTVVCMSSPRKRLLLIHVDDMAEAVLQVLTHSETQGRVYTVSHPENITVRQYVDQCIRRGEHHNIRMFYIPYAIALSMAFAAKVVKKITGFGPSLNRRRLLSVYRDLQAGSARLKSDTGWQPQGSLLERLAKESQTPITEKEIQVKEVPVGQA